MLVLVSSALAERVSGFVCESERELRPKGFSGSHVVHLLACPGG